MVIKAAVKSLKGVDTVESDHTREWAHVVYDKKKVKAGEIFQKLKESGFEPSLWSKNPKEK